MNMQKETCNARLRLAHRLLIAAAQADPDLTFYKLRRALQQEDQMTAPKIIRIVCDVFGDVTPEEILGDSRPLRIAFPRQVAMVLTLESSPLMSRGQVAKMFRRDRTNVTHAVKAVRNRSETEPYVREKIEAARMRLKS